MLPRTCAAALEPADFAPIYEEMNGTDRFREVSITAARYLAETDSIATVFEQLCALLAESLGEMSAYLALLHDGKLRVEFAFDDGVARHLNVCVADTSPAYAVVSSRRTAITQSDERRRAAMPDASDALHGTFAPLTIGRDTLGVFWASRLSHKPFSPDDVALIEAIAGYLCAAASNHRAALATLELEEIAGTDALTGVANRRAFDQRLAAESASLAQLGLLMIDIDYFKAYNDTYGHPAGDEALIAVAKAAAACLGRTQDLFARYGGEEFAVILPRTTLEGAAALAENVRAAIAALQLPHAGSPDGVVTVSIGVASAAPSPQREPAILIELADRALYHAKMAGRNRVTRSDEEVVFDSAAARPVSLPVPTSRFFGRERELDALGRLLGVQRVITLIGPGGIGKTRLALQAALQFADRFPDGVRFADFASVLNPDRVPFVVAAALGIAPSADSPVLSQITAALDSRRVLIIFDNCEHLIAACASLAEALLRAAPGLSIVATAREALRIDGEITYALSPLPSEEAIELFRERALSVDPTQTFSEEDGALFGPICQSLDCIPMAIELAAARINMFSVPQLLENLSDRFSLLSEGRRFASERQQTLWNLIDWSYRLLDESERKLFHRLSVFAGDWTFEAVGQACFDAGVPPHARLPVFSALVSKSLVAPSRHPTGVRYRLLESIRQYAHRQLVESGEEAQVRKRHAAYYAAFVAHISHSHNARQSDTFVSTMELEYANVRTALGTINEQHDVNLAAKLTSALDAFWSARGQFREGRYWIERCLQNAGELSAEVRVGLYRSLLRLSFYEGDYKSMRQTAELAMAIYKELGDREGFAQAQNGLAIAEHYAGDVEIAERLFSESLEIERELGNRRSMVYPLSNLGAIAIDHRGDFEGAAKIFRECLEISREVGDRSGESMDLSNLALCAFFAGETDRAIALSRGALKIARDLQNEPLTGSELVQLARYELEKGNLAESVLALKRGLSISRRLHNHEFTALAIETFARVALRLARFSDGAQLLAYAEKFRERHAVPMLPIPKREFEKLQAALRKPLGDVAFEKQWTIGKASTFPVISKMAVNMLTHGKKKPARA